MPDTWTIYASSGEFQETGEDVLDALAAFMRRRRDDYVVAIVNDAMKPGLVIEDDESCPLCGDKIRNGECRNEEHHYDVDTYLNNMSEDGPFAQAHGHSGPCTSLCNRLSVLTRQEAYNELRTHGLCDSYAKDLLNRAAHNSAYPARFTDLLNRAWEVRFDSKYYTVLLP